LKADRSDEAKKKENNGALRWIYDRLMKLIYATALARHRNESAIISRRRRRRR